MTDTIQLLNRAELGVCRNKSDDASLFPYICYIDFKCSSKAQADRIGIAIAQSINAGTSIIIDWGEAAGPVKVIGDYPPEALL